MPDFPITTVFDNNFYDSYSHSLKEIFDDMFSEDAFRQNAWIEPVSVPPYRLVFDLTSDKSGKISDDDHIAFRIQEAEKFVNAVNKIDKDNKDWPLALCLMDGSSIIFHGFSSKKELQEKVDKRFPSPDKNTLNHPEKALAVLQALNAAEMARGTEDYASIDFDSESVDSEPDFFKFVEENLDYVESFENAAESRGLYFEFHFDKVGKLVRYYLPVMAATRPEVYQDRLEKMQRDLAKMVMHQQPPAPTLTAATTRMLEFVRHIDKQRADNKKMHFFGTNDEAVVEDIADFNISIRTRI